MHPNKSILAKIFLPLAMLSLCCACHKEGEISAPPESTKGGGLVSAEKTTFDQVTSKLDKGGNFYLYLSTEQTLSALSTKVTAISNWMGSMAGGTGGQNEVMNKSFEVAANWLKDSGIQEISGVGGSSIAREPNFYYSKIVAYHYPGKNDGAIWKMFGKEPHPLHELDMLPETTAMASFADLDVPLVWKDVEKHLEELNNPAVTVGLHQWPEQFRKMAGMDFDEFLNSLGGNYGIILTLDPQKMVTLPIPNAAMEVPSPGLAIIAKVNSDLIFKRVDALAKGNPMVVRVDTSSLKMRTMTIPVPLPVELRPSIARSGDYLFLATSDTLIQDILAVQSGKKKGFKSSAEFARLSQGIPREGNNLSLITDQFMKTMMQIQQQTLTNKGTMTPAQVEAFQHVFNNATNYGAFSVGVNGPEGWVGYANGSQSMESIIASGAVGLGAAAAVGIPAFLKARAATQGVTGASPAPDMTDTDNLTYNQIIKNLRSLQTAKKQWASEKGKSDGDAATLQDITPYLTKGPIVAVADEEYDPQPVGKPPTARLAHDLKGHPAGSVITAPGPRKKKAVAQ